MVFKDGCKMAAEIYEIHMVTVWLMYLYPLILVNILLIKFIVLRFCWNFKIKILLLVNTQYK